MSSPTVVTRCFREARQVRAMPILAILARAASSVPKPKTIGDLVKASARTNTPSGNAESGFARTQTRQLKASAESRGISHLSDPENKGQRQTGVNYDVLGSWNYKLNLPVNVEQSIKRGSLVPEISLDNVGSASLLGRRKDNEDRMLITHVRPHMLLFAVFDGHGGAQAADHAQKHLIDHVTFWLDRGERNLETVLKKSFIDLNNVFTRECYRNRKDEGAMSSGTTATVCLLHDDVFLYVAHVGDSRAVLCRNGKALKLTKDHCPEDKEEQERIKENKGFIAWSSIGKPRVNGQLQMTRSIGDLELKPYGVTAVPETQKLMVRHSRDAFLALCTDGVHNVLTSQELVDVISGSRDPDEAAHLVADQALLFGSEDNSTALIVPFGAWGKFQPVNKVGTRFHTSMFGSRN